MATEEFDRLLRRRTALEERSNKLEEEATITALAECGPKRDDPAWQAAFDVAKEKALDRGKQQVREEIAAVDAKLAQKEAIEKALPEEFNKAAKAPGPTKDFNQQAERD